MNRKVIKFRMLLLSQFFLACKTIPSSLQRTFLSTVWGGGSLLRGGCATSREEGRPLTKRVRNVQRNHHGKRAVCNNSPSCTSHSPLRGGSNKISSTAAKYGRNGKRWPLHFHGPPGGTRCDKISTRSERDPTSSFCNNDCRGTPL